MSTDAKKSLLRVEKTVKDFIEGHTYLTLIWTDKTALPLRIYMLDPQGKEEKKIAQRVRDGSSLEEVNEDFRGKIYYCENIADSPTRNWRILQILADEEVLQLAEAALYFNESLDKAISKR